MSFFEFDQRLGIRLPNLALDWDAYDGAQQEAIIYEWEQIRGGIPSRIFAVEEIINKKQALLNSEESFVKSCILNSEIAELASVINDLQIWYRVGQDLTVERIHG
jgi:hypothetical protein